MSGAEDGAIPGMVRRGRSMQVIALLGSLALLGLGLVLAIYVDRTYELQRVEQATAQARILAATATAALAFGDRQAAQEYADALRAGPDIVAVGLYDSAGRPFVRFPRGEPATLPPVLRPSEQPQPPAGLFAVTVPILQDGHILGTAILQAPVEPVARRVQRYGAIALLLAMASLLVSVLGIAHAALRRANAELADRARALILVNRSLEEQIAHREKAEAALRQAQKMEAVGQLTGGVAHDFNNLLQVVLGSLDRLRARVRRGEGAPGTDLEPLIEAAMRGAQRAAILTQRLLAFSRRQPLAPKPIDVNRLVGGMSDLLGRTLGEAVRIETMLAGGLWRVSADENQLENALLNLAVNARDAMPAGGRLTIETANVHLDESFARTSESVRPGEYVLIAVTDTGTGMTQDVLDKVFEPFFTTKDIGQGTGLGLSQVYGFIRQSGGHVTLYSAPGRGTTVKLHLPRLTAAGEPAEPAGEAAPVSGGSALECVLVVEDEHDVRALTVAMLRDLGYAVREAADGPSALAVLRRHGDIRLLFTDVGLPGGLNGRQLAEAARQMQRGLRVLFTTGYARDGIVHHGRLDPGVELIGKPFTAVELAHKVRGLLDAREHQGAAGA